MPPSSSCRVFHILCCSILIFLALLFWGASKSQAQSSLEYMALQGQVQGSMQKAAGQVQQPSMDARPLEQSGQEAAEESASGSVGELIGKFGPKQIVVLLVLLAVLWLLMHK